MKIGLIGIVGQELDKDFWGTMQKVAATGYQGIETGRHALEKAGMPLPELSRRLQDLGLVVITLGSSKDSFANGSLAPIETAKAIGAKRITFYYGPCDSVEQLKRDAEVYNEIGARCREHGIELLYHNHDHEFRRFGDQYGLDILMENTDPELVKLNLDVAWVYFGGAQPDEVIRHYAGRCPVLHIKDLLGLEPGCESASGDRGKARFTEVGTGVVPVKSAVAAAEDAGVEWLTVEQDRLRDLPAFESIEVSYRNLRRFVDES